MTAPTYLNPPVHYTVAEFRTMLAALKLGVMPISTLKVLQTLD